MTGQSIRLTVRGDAHPQTSVPVHATIEVPPGLAHLAPEDVAVQMRGPATIPGQIYRDRGGQARLAWIIPSIGAGQAQRWTATLSELRGRRDESGFRFYEKSGRYLDLFQGNRRVTRYMYARDTSTPERAVETFKTFHHVFDPTGQSYITNGPAGRYPHHRGIFIGWSRMQYLGERYDLWHMGRGEAQVHRKFLERTAGPVLARSTDLLHWLTNETPSGVVLLEEVREVTVYRQADPTLLFMDFVTTLTASSVDVEVRGDSEHAGIHFRAENTLTGREPDGNTPAPIPPDARLASFLLPKEELVEYTRDDAEKHPGMPWAVMNFKLNGQEYSVLHLNHSDNPENTEYSAYRDYGRFGAYPYFDLKKGESKTLKYRIVILTEPMPSRPSVNTAWTAFATPPAVRVEN